MRNLFQNLQASNSTCIPLRLGAGEVAGGGVEGPGGGGRDGDEHRELDHGGYISGGYGPKAVREQGLARRAFVDAMRIVDALAVQLQEARHGDCTDVMVALGASEFVMFTELRTTKIRELFKSDEESAAAQDLMVEVRLYKCNPVTSNP